MKKIVIGVIFTTTSFLCSMDSDTRVKLSPRKSKGPDSFQPFTKSRPRIDSDPVQRVRAQSDSKKIVDEHNKAGFELKSEEKK